MYLTLLYVLNFSDILKDNIMVNQIHTMKDKETGTWYNKQDGAKRASNAGFATQKEAADAARNIAINQGLEHSIHRADNNQIREKNSYGNDDYPPKD